MKNEEEKWGDEAADGEARDDGFMRGEDEYQPIKPESEGETIRKSGLAYAAAFTLFASVAVMLGAGYLIDRYFGSTPWGLVGGVILGSIVGLYQFVKITSKISD